MSSPERSAPRETQRFPRRVLWELLGPAWILVAAVCVFAPALSHGLSLGPYHDTAASGLTSNPSVAIPNRFQHDLITQMIPWSSLAWLDVHHGHLPLWNPFSVLGTPLVFNWQSSAFSLRAAVGYLFPLDMAYTVQCVLTTLIAGWGAYVFCRTVRLGRLSSTLGGTIFLLSSPFFAWVGWPIAAEFSWLGWILAGIVVIKRARHRVGGITLVAVASALSVYAGQPDCLLITAALVAVFFVAEFMGDATVLGGGGVRPRFAIDTAGGVGLGILLSAPLLLPGSQLIADSVRRTGGSALGGQAPMSLHGLTTIFVGFDGSLLPWTTGIGSVAVVLAAVGMYSWRRDVHMRAVLCMGVVAGVIVASSLVIRFLTLFPALNAVRWPRVMTVLAFAVSVLAAFGLDRLVREPKRRELTIAGVGFSLVLVAVGSLAVFGGPPDRLPLGFQWPFPANIRARTLLAEALLAALGAGLAFGLRAVVTRPRPTGIPLGRLAAAAGVVLLAAETAFLVVGGSSLWTSGPGFTPSPAEVALQRSVGSDLVGLTGPTCLLPPGTGLEPNTNILSDVHEMAVYDPMLPKGYYDTWKRVTGTEGGAPSISTFCPDVTSAAVAREFGISYVLVTVGGRPPAGTVFVERIGRGRAAEDLYRVPGAAAATFVPQVRGPTAPTTPSPGTPLRIRHPDHSTWVVRTDTHRSGVVRFHLTASPGWSATIDGATLPLRGSGGIMLQANVPAGRHTIVLRYWPPLFTVGLVLALCGLVALGALGVAVAWSRRR